MYCNSIPPEKPIKNPGRRNLRPGCLSQLGFVSVFGIVFRRGGFRFAPPGPAVGVGQIAVPAAASAVEGAQIVLQSRNILRRRRLQICVIRIVFLFRGLNQRFGIIGFRFRLGLRRGFRFRLRLRFRFKYRLGFCGACLLRGSRCFRRGDFGGHFRFLRIILRLN